MIHFTEGRFISEVTVLKICDPYCLKQKGEDTNASERIEQMRIYFFIRSICFSGSAPVYCTLVKKSDIDHQLVRHPLLLVIIAGDANNV